MALLDIDKLIKQGAIFVGARVEENPSSEPTAVIIGSYKNRDKKKRYFIKFHYGSGNPIEAEVSRKTYEAAQEEMEKAAKRRQNPN